MATKTTRKTTSMSTSVSSSQETPYSSPSTSSGRPQSPLSPNKISRLQEKVELQNLNDRLAAYIDRVRHLEQENSRLHVMVETSQESVTREVNSVKSMYETELADARRLLDDTAKEKAKLQIDCTKYKNENEELAAKLAKKEKDFAVIEKSHSRLEYTVNDLQSRLNQAMSDKKKAEDEAKELRAENEKLLKQLEALRKQLEAETLARVDFQNRMQSLKEEISFKQQVHDQELTETRTKKQVEISEIDDRLQEQYQQKLAETLIEIREQYEMQMRINRDEIEKLYESKLHDLKAMNDHYINSSASVREELVQTKNRLSHLQGRLAELESQNASLLSRVNDLERMLEEERAGHLALLARKQDEIRALQDSIAQQLQDYNDLMDIKVALDLEITAYRKLLEGEEARLNMTPRSADVIVKRSTPVRRGGTPLSQLTARGTKRKRTILTHSDERSLSNFSSKGSAKGDVEIVEQDIQGKYVKVHNKGEKDVGLGAWQLIRRVGDQEVTYKFHRSFTLKAGMSTTLWSSDSSVTHSPPADIVMKNIKWLTGPKIETLLYNNSGEEMAIRETSRSVMSSSSIQSTDSGNFLLEGDEGSEDMFHQQGDPQNPERCVIM